ncbi:MULTISPECIES: zinc-ribbon domain-containing protein [Frankiaceae]|uniref:zinc-ribbon domain-containing protein n=1 Tax=Frankiaceae TaxID=74712 RepID=UPI001D021530
MHPGLAAQLDPTLNGDLTGAELRPRSNRRVWWRCPHDHTWQAPVTRRGTGYPHCRQTRPREDLSPETVPAGRTAGSRPHPAL